MVFTHGDFLKERAEQDATMEWLRPYLHYHHMLSFGLFSIMLVASILGLRPVKRTL